MTIAPLLPLSGYAGWRYLQRTLLEQQARVAASTTTQREETYFREKIGGVTSAADLVADRRLLQVALSAFGLEEQIDSKALIRQVLEGGTTDSDALANRLNNKAYAALAEAFAFDGETSAIAEEGFADRILRSYETQTFQNAVTEQNETLGLALNAQQEIAALAETGSSDATKWYSILASSSEVQAVQASAAATIAPGALRRTAPSKRARQASASPAQRCQARARSGACECDSLVLIAALWPLQASV